MDHIIWSISYRSLKSRESGQLISEILRITYGQNLCWMDSVLKLLHCDFPVFGMPISLLLVWPTCWPDIFVWTYMFILSDSLSDLKSFEFKKRSFHRYRFWECASLLMRGKWKQMQLRLYHGRESIQTRKLSFIIINQL